MSRFVEGTPIAKVGCYGPADIEYDSRYWDMRIVIDNDLPWIMAVHRTSAEVTMLNCAKCACILLGPRGGTET